MLRRIAKSRLLICVVALSAVASFGASASHTIRIASWNVLNLNKTTPVDERAEVIAQYDIVALQEVESLEGLERLRQAVEERSGVTWKTAASPKVGEGQAAEYYAFIYRADRVSETAGPHGVYPASSSTEFSRPPFYDTFKAGNFDFTLITVHITFATPASRRADEVRRLKQVWIYVHGLEPKEDDLLLMGDFNTNRPTNLAFDPLRELGLVNLITGDSTTFTTYSTRENRVGSAWYDNIWMDPSHTAAEHMGSSGIDFNLPALLHERALPTPLSA